MEGISAGSVLIAGRLTIAKSTPAFRASGLLGPQEWWCGIDVVRGAAAAGHSLHSEVDGGRIQDRPPAGFFGTDRSPPVLPANRPPGPRRPARPASQSHLVFFHAAWFFQAHLQPCLWIDQAVPGRMVSRQPSPRRHPQHAAHSARPSPASLGRPGAQVASCLTPDETSCCGALRATWPH